MNILSWLPQFYKATLPCDADGQPYLDPHVITHYVGDFLHIEWRGHGLVLYGENYRPRGEGLAAHLSGMG